MQIKKTGDRGSISYPVSAVCFFSSNTRLKQPHPLEEGLNFCCAAGPLRLSHLLKNYALSVIHLTGTVKENVLAVLFFHSHNKRLDFCWHGV